MNSILNFLIYKVRLLRKIKDLSKVNTVLRVQLHYCLVLLPQHPSISNQVAVATLDWHWPHQVSACPRQQPQSHKQMGVLDRTFLTTLAINCFPRSPAPVCHISPLEKTLLLNATLVVWIDYSGPGPGTPKHSTHGPNKGMHPRPCLPLPVLFRFIEGSCFNRCEVTPHWGFNLHLSDD